MGRNRYSNIIAFDDAPFQRDYIGKVKIIGTVFADLRFDGVVIGEVKKDGFDAAEQIAELISGSKFREHVQLIMLQGITLAGFNVVDVFRLHEVLNLPILVISRRQPDFESIRKALLSGIPYGEEKLRLIEKLEQMQNIGDVYVQRIGISEEDAEAVIRHFTCYGKIPEPIRIAHLIAGAVGEGESRGRP